MHETHLIQPIVNSVSRHATKEGAKTVTKLRLKVGQLLGIKEASFKETFGMLAKGTVLENAELELVFFPGTKIEIISFDIE